MATIGYRTILEVDGHDPIHVAERNIREWLRGKLGGYGALDAWDGLSSHRFSKNLHIRVIVPKEDSRQHRRLYRLTDQNPGGRFEVSVYAARDGDRAGHLVVTASRAGSTPQEAIDVVATPKLVGQILDDIEVRDGDVIIGASARVIRPEDIRDVVDAITDPDRSMAVIVASSVSPGSDEQWKALVDQLTRNSVGVATTFVIYADAVDQLNELLPESHRVPRGRVRTFVPAVDLEDPADALAHRFVGPATLARSIRGRRMSMPLIVAHARGPRTKFLERSLPSYVRRTIDVLEKEERTQLRAAAVEERLASAPSASTVLAPAVSASESAGDGAARSTETDTPDVPDGVRPIVTLADTIVTATRHLVRKWLGRETATHADLVDLERFVAGQVEEVKLAQEQIDEEAARYASVREERDALRDQLERHELESLEVAEELSTLRHQAAWMRRRLRDVHVFEEALPDEMWSVAPNDVTELVARLTSGEGQHAAFDRVEFTRDADAPCIVELQKYDITGRYAYAFWDYVRVLYDYAELKASKKFAGNVHQYLTDDSVDGYKCSHHRHAGRESATVLQNEKWRLERVHPVPRNVHADGEVLMDAHFRPTHRDTFAPRMHYFDDTDNSGKIYIGYIGRHLTNTQT